MSLSRHFSMRASALIVAAFCAAVANAASNNVTVPGISDIWLAGEPNGTVANGGFGSFDQAPTNSPVLASTGLNMTAGSYLTVSVSGATNYGGCASPSPDGGGACGGLNVTGHLSVSGFNGPVNALVGVFLDDNVPSGAAPAGLDFSTPASLTQATLSPQLNQVFFLGDGMTGTGSGSVQHFVIPTGATRLFLASSDGFGANYNNSSSLAVVVSDATSGPAGATGVPALSPFMLLLTALLVVSAGIYALARR